MTRGAVSLDTGGCWGRGGRWWGVEGPSEGLWGGHSQQSLIGFAFVCIQGFLFGVHGAHHAVFAVLAVVLGAVEHDGVSVVDEDAEISRLLRACQSLWHIQAGGLG